MSESRLYIDVILPLAVGQAYTYRVPGEFIEHIRIGIRVEVPLRNQLYSGIVAAVKSEHHGHFKAKDITNVIDTVPIVQKEHLELWEWVASYYCCTVGEVMNAALPAGLKLVSETRILPGESENEDLIPELSDDEFMVFEALSNQGELSVDQLVSILGKKTILPVIRSLLDKSMISVKEELLHTYKKKYAKTVKPSQAYHSNEAFVALLDNGLRSEKQERFILTYLGASPELGEIELEEIYRTSNTDFQTAKALVNKGVFELGKIEKSRINLYDEETAPLPPLSDEQTGAVEAIRRHFEEERVVLLHGITGSGKTRVYIECMERTLAQGKQCLYLLPEIALTTQIVKRLENFFGTDLVTYHSKLSNAERVEIWRAVADGKKIVLGPRSSTFLPFKDIGLIIVDEEHDPSYKQNEPNPKYHGRDLAVYMAKKFNSPIMLGSATPSLETYHHARSGKYGLIRLNKRYGDSILPRTITVDLKRERQIGRLRDTCLSHDLKNFIRENLDQKKQVILFQNRRGFAPVLQCSTCGWTAECTNCDVSLTLHKYFQELRCHYCNQSLKSPTACPDCGSIDLFEMGLGTERIERDVRDAFPQAKTARMDYDTAKSKKKFDTIIQKFAAGQTDILIGTQMVTKGFDFDRLGLVAVINADSMLRYPDFRAGERAFQLMTQVAGRAGRRSEQGLAVIQAYAPDHPVIHEVIHYQYEAFFAREMHERKQFNFPPFCRLIHIEMKHAKSETLQKASALMTQLLKEKLGSRVKGPIIPSISRIRNRYIQLIVIRLENDPKRLFAAKQWIQHFRAHVLNAVGFKSVRINVDVDPY